MKQATGAGSSVPMYSVFAKAQHLSQQQSTTGSGAQQTKVQPLKPSKKMNMQIKSPRSQMQSHTSVGAKNYLINPTNQSIYNQQQYQAGIKSPTMTVDYEQRHSCAIQSSRVTKQVPNENQQNQAFYGSSNTVRAKNDTKYSKSTKVSPRRQNTTNPQQQQKQSQQQQQYARQYVNPMIQDQSSQRQSIVSSTRLSIDQSTMIQTKINNSKNILHHFDVNAQELSNTNVPQTLISFNNNTKAKYNHSSFEDPIDNHSLSIHSSFANMIYPSKSKKLIAQQSSLNEETFNPQQFQKQVVHHQKSKSLLIGDYPNKIDDPVVNNTNKIQQSHCSHNNQSSVFNYSQRLKQLLSEDENSAQNRQLFSQQPSPSSKKANLSSQNLRKTNQSSFDRKNTQKIGQTFDDGKQINLNGQLVTNIIQGATSSSFNKNINNKIVYPSSQHLISQTVDNYKQQKQRGSTPQTLSQQAQASKSHLERMSKAQSKKIIQPIKNNYVIDIGSYQQSKENSRERQYNQVDQNSYGRQPSREKKQHQPTQSKLMKNSYGINLHQRSVSDYVANNSQFGQPRYSYVKNDLSQELGAPEMSITPTNNNNNIGSSFLKQYSQSFLDQNHNMSSNNLSNNEMKTSSLNIKDSSSKSQFIQNAQTSQRSNINQNYLDSVISGKSTSINHPTKNLYQQRKLSYQPTASSAMQSKRSSPKQPFISKESCTAKPVISQTNYSRVSMKSGGPQQQTQNQHQQQQTYVTNNLSINKYKNSGGPNKKVINKPTQHSYQVSILTSPVGGQSSNLSMNNSIQDKKINQNTPNHICGPKCSCNKKPQQSHSTASLGINHKRSKSDLQSTILAHLGKNHYNQQQEKIGLSIGQSKNQGHNESQFSQYQNIQKQQRPQTLSSQVTPKKMGSLQAAKRSVANVSIDLSKSSNNQKQTTSQHQQQQNYQNTSRPLLQDGNQKLMNFDQNNAIKQRKSSYVDQSRLEISPNDNARTRGTQNAINHRTNTNNNKDLSLFSKHKQTYKYSVQISPSKNNFIQHKELSQERIQKLNSNIIQGCQSSSVIGLASTNNLLSPVNHSSISFVQVREASNPRIIHNVSYDAQKPKSQRYKQEPQKSQAQASARDQKKANSKSVIHQNHKLDDYRPSIDVATSEVEMLLQQINKSYQPNLLNQVNPKEMQQQQRQSQIDNKIFQDIESYLKQQNNNSNNNQGMNDNQLFKITEASMDHNYVETNENVLGRRKNDTLYNNNNKTMNLQVNTKNDTLSSQIYLTTDPNGSPLSKDLFKLKKVIKLNFKKFDEPPVTTSEFYRIGRVLGRGAFGKVNLAAHKLSEQLVAIKSINKEFLKSEKDQKTKIMQEFGILRQNCHPSVVRIYDSFETSQHICFVMELCSGGDLLTYVRKRRKLKEDVAKYFFKQLMEGLSYIHHSKLIVHRDIKLDNILLDSSGRIKIADFGVSRQVTSETERMHEQCGTPAYIAPEILKDKGYEGFKVDVWSAGVCLYAMLVGTVPFKAAGMHELHSLIINGKYDVQNENLTDGAKDLITKLMCVDPKKRLNAYEVLSHPWLKDAQNELDVFTQKEKDLIYKEYLSKNIHRQNRNNNNMTSKALLQTNNLETEVVFTEHDLDTKTNGGSFLKNASTKSIILAPFNSTISDFDEDNQYEWPDEIKNQLQNKRVIKFAAKCRDVNRQYEQNNNADLDNGVYNQFVNEQEKEDALNNGAANNDKSDGGRAGSEASAGSLEKSFKETELSSDDEKADLQVEEAHEKQLKQQSDLQEFEQQIKLKYVKYQEPVEEIDYDVIDEIVTLGLYPKGYLLTSLKNKEMNYATATYNLICKKHQSVLKMMMENLEGQAE